MFKPETGRVAVGWEPAQDWERSALGLYVPPRRRRRYLRPVAIDLFAGAGGFSLGLHRAGFHVAAAVEFDPWAAISYTVNLGRPWHRGGVQFHFDTPKRAAAMDKAVAKHLGRKGGKSTVPPAGSLDSPDGQLLVQGDLLVGGGWISHYGCPGCASCAGTGADSTLNDDFEQVQRPPAHPDGCEHFWVADARNVSGAEILAALQLEPDEVDLVAGGPPCQGFSRAGERQVLDPRNSLVFEFARLVLEIRPKALVMENVPDMVSMVTPEGLNVVDALCKVLADGGFAPFNALKQSLLASSGAGAALRSGRPPSSKRERRAGATPANRPAVEGQQDTLFG